MEKLIVELIFVDILICEGELINLGIFMVGLELFYSWSGLNDFFFNE